MENGRREGCRMRKGTRTKNRMARIAMISVGRRSANPGSATICSDHVAARSNSFRTRRDDG
jgi:hypothetical protein